MAQLPTRGPGNTKPEHISDHNELHRLHNILDGSTVPSTGVVSGVDGGVAASAVSKIQARGGTAAEWTAANPVLRVREFGIETDTRSFKVGDGVTPWSSLAYFIPDISLNNFLGSPPSQAAMLALVGQRGDWCIRTDLAQAFFVTGEPSSSLVNWQALPSGITPPIDPAANVGGSRTLGTGATQAYPGNSGATNAAAITSEATTARAAEGSKLPLAGGTLTGPVVLSGAPTQALHAATKQYVDATAQGLSPKASVVGASTTNHSVTAYSGTTIDTGSVSLVAGNRILLKDQTTASQNGIWVFNGAGSALTRPADFASGALEDGAFTFVEAGTTNGSSGWVLSGTAVTVDTTAETWTQFSGAGEIVAGTALTKTGNTLAVILGTAAGNAYPGDSGATNATNIAANTTAIAGKAADTAVVHNTGAETVAGVKNFTSGPTVSGVGVARVTEGPLSALDPRVGMKFDGTTDDTTALLAGITLLGTGGGTLFFPPNAGIALISGQITFPVTGATPPAQSSYRLTGAGPSHNGQGGAPLGGTVLDMRYNGSGVAKIDTRGLGMLEIDHLTMKDNGGDAKPFIQTTNTTLLVHHCEFHGDPAKSGLTCDQDAIILGGTSLTLDGSSNAAFQGYGTVIKDNYFSRIRRAVFGRTFANGVVVRDNTIWTTCGSNLSAGAAIEFVGLSGNTCSGNVIVDNLIEYYGYPYGVKLDYAIETSLRNNFYDGRVGITLAAYRFEDNGVYNRVEAGFHFDTIPFVSESPGAAGSNAFLNGHQSQRSDWPQPWRYLNTVEFAGQSGVGPLVLDNGGGASRFRTVTASNGVTKAVVCVIPPTQVTDAVTTTGSPTVTSASNAFSGAVVGQAISGTGIPTGSFIAATPAPTAGSITMTKNATASATITANFGKPGTELQMTAFHNHHIIGSGSAPSPAVAAAAGTGATVSLTGTDAAMSVTLTTGTGPTSGTLMNINAALAYSIATPRVGHTPKNQAAANFFRTADVWLTTSASGTNSIVLLCGTAPPASTVLIFDLVLLGA